MGLPIFPNPCFGPNELGLYLGCYGGTRAWRRAHCAFGLASGILGLFLYPYQLPPSPCVRTAWAKAVIIPATVAISTCLFGYGLIKPDHRQRGMLMMALWVSRMFFILTCFPLFLADLPSFEFLWPYTFLFFFIS